MDDLPKVVTTRQLSIILNLSERRVRQLAGEDTFPRATNDDGSAPDGRFLFPESVHAYVVRRVRENIEQQAAAEPDEVAEKRSQAKLRRELGLAEEIEQKNLIRRGETHIKEDVAAIMDDMHNSIKSRALAIPQKLSRQLVGIENPADINAILTEAVNEFLNESKEYDFEEFAARNSDYLAELDKVEPAEVAVEQD